MARRVFRPLPSGMLWPAIVVFVLVTRRVVLLPGPAAWRLRGSAFEQHAHTSLAPRRRVLACDAPDTALALVLPPLAGQGPMRFAPLLGGAAREGRQDE